MTAGNWKITSKFIFQKQLKPSLIAKECLVYNFLTDCWEEARGSSEEEGRQAVLKGAGTRELQGLHLDSGKRHALGSRCARARCLRSDKGCGDGAG